MKATHARSLYTSRLPRPWKVHDTSSLPSRFRPFHSSRPNRFEFASLVDGALSLSHECFQGVHSLSGLSWALSIPLTGILFRLSWLPVQWYINRDQKKSLAAQPLLLSWQAVYRAQAACKYPGGAERDAIHADQWYRHLMARKQKELSAKYGGGKRLRDISLSLSFLPIWICNIDVLRRMSGLDKTLLSSFQSTDGKLNTENVPPEPTFATEGMLWFSDLTVADPTTIMLPLCWASLLYVTYWFSGGRTLESLKARQSGSAVGTQEWRRVTTSIFFIQLGQTFALVAFWIPIIQSLPSGVMLYLIASAGTVTVQKPLLASLMGFKKPIAPARGLKPTLRPEYLPKVTKQGKQIKEP